VSWSLSHMFFDRVRKLGHRRKERKGFCANIEQYQTAIIFLIPFNCLRRESVSFSFSAYLIFMSIRTDSAVLCTRIMNVIHMDLTPNIIFLSAYQLILKSTILFDQGGIFCTKYFKFISGQSFYLTRKQLYSFLQ
jgi:hypothetical protein